MGCSAVAAAGARFRVRRISFLFHLNKVLIDIDWTIACISAWRGGLGGLHFLPPRRAVNGAQHGHYNDSLHTTARVRRDGFIIVDCS